VAGTCSVCGFATDAAVCPRCSTILLKGQAICPKCGKRFQGSIATCDACGAELRAKAPAPDADAVQELAAVPGIGEVTARELAARGFKDFSDVVRLALPESAVSKGLHHSIARKVLLSTLGAGTEVSKGGAPCPSCGTAWPPGAERCAICGATPDAALDVEALEQKLHAVTGEIVDLSADPDFQDMPSEVREELLSAFGGYDETELIKEECRRQIEAWRRKGFDVEPLERLLDEDPSGFQEKSVRLIRTQMMKKAEGGRFRCPLCDVVLKSVAAECPNCGALFE